MGPWFCLRVPVEVDSLDVNRTDDGVPLDNVRALYVFSPVVAVPVMPTREMIGGGKEAIVALFFEHVKFLLEDVMELRGRATAVKSVPNERFMKRVLDRKEAVVTGKNVAVVHVVATERAKAAEFAAHEIVVYNSVIEAELDAQSPPVFAVVTDNGIVGNQRIVAEIQPDATSKTCVDPVVMDP